MVTKHHKSAARILDRDCITRVGLDLSKEVLWISVYQRAAELPAVKVGGKKIFAAQPGSNLTRSRQQSGKIFFKRLTLMNSSSTVL